MINGWTEDEIERLERKTARSRGAVETFCRAVDKRLYLMLDERQRKATLHFHLREAETPPNDGATPAVS